MVKVITYGTFDLLHRGHLNLLERARQLGDYLIVGVTADDFDEARGKVNVRQSLSERMEAVRATGLADEIIVEEYEGQKIDDIRRMGVDVFTVGSDWRGKFDYLSRYCKVVYLERTAGVSSTELRSSADIGFGLMGGTPFMSKYLGESGFVNGLKVVGACIPSSGKGLVDLGIQPEKLMDATTLLSSVDAIYIATAPSERPADVARALSVGVHVLCESPIAVSVGERDRLFRKKRVTSAAYGRHTTRELLLGAFSEQLANDGTAERIVELSHQGARIAGTRWLARTAKVYMHVNEAGQQEGTRQVDNTMSRSIQSLVRCRDGDDLAFFDHDRTARHRLHVLRTIQNRCIDKNEILGRSHNASRSRCIAPHSTPLKRSHTPVFAQWNTLGTRRETPAKTFFFPPPSADFPRIPTDYL